MPQNKERHKQYVREYRARKKAEAEDKIKRDPCDLNDLGNKGNEPLKAVPLSWTEWHEENPSGSKGDWVKYKLNFPTQQLEEDWKAEPKRQQSTPLNDRMGTSGGMDKAGWISLCPWHGCQLDKDGSCPMCKRGCE